METCLHPLQLQSNWIGLILRGRGMGAVAVRQILVISTLILWIQYPRLLLKIQSKSMGACCSDQKKITSASNIPGNSLFLTETQKQIRYNTIFQHPRNPHNLRFKVKGIANGAIQIVNVYYDKGCHTLMLNNPIPTNEITTFKVKQVKTHSHNILFGVATESIFGINDAFQHRQAITYSTYSGDIWQNEEGRAGGRKVHDGQTVKMVVDTKNWTVGWSVEGEQLGVSNIGQNLRGRGLYFVVMMFSKNDTVEIAFD